MKRFLIVTVSMVCSLLWSASAHAQTCTGSLSYATAPLQVGALAAFSSDSHTFAAGVGAGRDAYFARVGAQLISSSGVDSGAKGIFAMAGAEYKLDAAQPFFVCPIVTVAHNWGPSFGAGDDESSTFFGVGGSVGFVAAKSGQTTIVPSAGLNFNHLSQSATFNFLGTATTSSFGNTFGSLQIGAGFIFNDRMSLVPSIVLPFGENGASTIFSALFSIQVGH
jgi:hypothetical protein